MLSSILDVKTIVSSDGYISVRKKSSGANPVVSMKSRSQELPGMVFWYPKIKFSNITPAMDAPVRLIRTYRAKFTLSAQTLHSHNAALSVFQTEVQDMASAFKAVNGVQAPTTPHFDTPEEAEDERKWGAIVSTFSSNDFALLDDWANELIQESGTEPLDFTGR